MSSASSVSSPEKVFKDDEGTSRATLHGGYVRPIIGKHRKRLMLFLFCFAELMDAFIASALFPAINSMEVDLDFRPGEVTWVFSAYSATFAAFLLISGRVSDIYSARWCFIVGAFSVGAFCLGNGFVNGKIAMFILRAFAGIAAAMTVPSALSLIIEWFPDPDEQAQAIAFFGGCSAVGNVFGIIVGGAFVQGASWRWILWFTAILAIIISAISLFAVPPSAPRINKPDWRRLDLVGVTAFTGSLLLFVYAVTTGSVDGWRNAKVIATLVVSIVLIGAFFAYEAFIDPSMAALPPSIWNHPNMKIIVAVASIPFLWWCSLFFQLMPRMQNVYHWSPILTSVRFLPTGVFSTAVAGFSANLVKYTSPKWTILGGLTLEFIANLLVPFADSRDRYWSFLFPAFVIGTIGTMVVYTNSNIAVFLNTPPEQAGVVGALYNSSLQLGLALGLAIIASITTSIDSKRVSQGIATKEDYTGMAAGFWFIAAYVGFMALMVLVWYRVEGTAKTVDAERSDADTYESSHTNGDGSSIQPTKTPSVTEKELRP